MPSVLPTIPNDPPQGIQALLDKVYLWNPDVSNELIEKVNALLAKLGDAIGAIRPYNEMVAPISQYEPCYYGDGVYVAARELTEVPAEFNTADWILIATKTDETKLLSKEEAAETYLPLTGGEITGVLTLNAGDDAEYLHTQKPFLRIKAKTREGSTNPGTLDKTITVGADGTINLQKLRLVGAGDILPGDTIKDLGNTYNFWNVGYIRKLNNGATLNVPTVAGTLARLEDLTAGNVSITFAGQEDTLQNAINTLKTDQDELGDQVSAIESKIPADASETNQLVTKNEVLALPTFTYKVVNELPETGEERIIYLVPKAGEGNDVHDEYIWVNGGYELIGTTAVDLSGYLPLSGGTMTGEIGFKAISGGTGITRIARVGLNLNFFEGESSNASFILSTAGNNFYCRGGGSSLGISSYKWDSVYATKLNNGAAIAIPTTGGTIALAEDIAESVTTKDLTVGTDEGTLNIGITAGVATIATNNGLDIVSQTKFDTAPTTDDATAWASVNPTALVTKQQVVEGLGEGGTSVTIRNWA